VTHKTIHMTSNEEYIDTNLLSVSEDTIEEETYYSKGNSKASKAIVHNHQWN